MIRILNIEPEGYCDQARNILNSVGQVTESKLARPELISSLGEYDVLITRLSHQIDRQVIDAGKSLKAIVTATTGLDHIDVEYAKSKGVAVLSLRGEKEFLRSVKATPEHTWALLMSLVRRIPWAFDSVKDGRWERDLFRGKELNGKRLGILGLGRVGTKVARYALAFEMKVASYDPHVTEWTEGVERMSSLSELLAVSDILSIHLHLDDNTKGMLGHDELSLLPKGALLVNTSRGEIVELEALLTALKNGALAGAALDVIAGERDDISKGGALELLEYARLHDNLLITPHIAGATFESMMKTEIFMAEKLAAFLTGA